MVYDPLTELFVPLFFTLATSQTQDLYNKLFQCIECAVGVKPSPKDVVCDFEDALIIAVRDHFPSTRIIGCLFHFKQACRRKMKKYQLSETKSATLPSIADIQDSESEDESDSDSIDDNNHEEDPQLSDEDLELLYDVCPEQEEAAINRDTVYLSLSVTMMHRHATSATRNHSEHRPLRTKVHPFCN
ncbi:hypothetical protein PC123_g8184 [Phytophthora cactorum]|nr:hypothetical protein PC123_g8184 [Phytophthora cactorum]